MIGVPLLLLFVALTFEYSGLDIAISSHFYDSTTGAWPFKEGFWLRHILYERQNDLARGLYILVLAVFVLSHAVEPLRRWRRPVLFLIVACASGPLAVALIKSLTHIYTPWRLEIFGGDYPYIRVFDSVPSGMRIGHAFPGGHSSGAYAWIALYFLLRLTAHPWRYRVLTVVVGTGILFSATQIIRGAHFVSHELVTAAICWATGCFWSLVFFGANRLRSDRRAKNPSSETLDAPR